MITKDTGSNDTLNTSFNSLKRRTSIGAAIGMGILALSSMGCDTKHIDLSISDLKKDPEWNNRYTRPNSAVFDTRSLHINGFLTYCMSSPDGKYQYYRLYERKDANAPSIPLVAKHNETRYWSDKEHFRPDSVRLTGTLRALRTGKKEYPLKNDDLFVFYIDSDGVVSLESQKNGK